MFCKESSECQGSPPRFCNFDEHESGFCEYCHDILKSSIGCLEGSFINKRGEEECQRICEGVFHAPMLYSDICEDVFLLVEASFLLWIFAGIWAYCLYLKLEKQTGAPVSTREINVPALKMAKSQNEYSELPVKTV